MDIPKGTKEYKNWVEELKAEIQNTQIKATISVNQQLLKLYWTIGKSISEKINLEKWGNSVVENLSKDLKLHFTNQKGFSRTNLFSMRKWYEFYMQANIEIEKVQQLVGQIPWGHNVLIITKANTTEEALRGTTQPIGVAEYEIIKSIPNDLKPQLPTIEKIEEELSSTLRNTE